MIALTPGPTASISVTSTTGNVAIATAQPQLLLTNIGSTICYIKTGTDSTVEAAVTDMPVLANSAIVITRPAQHDYIAAITASSTTTLKITQCTGI